MNKLPEGKKLWDTLDWSLFLTDAIKAFKRVYPEYKENTGCLYIADAKSMKEPIYDIFLGNNLDKNKSTAMRNIFRLRKSRLMAKTSWRIGDDSLKTDIGGAIHVGSIIISFSGTGNSLCDEAVSIFFAFSGNLISRKEAIRLANSDIFERMAEVAEMV